MATSLQYSVKYSYIFLCNLKTIPSIFMKFSGKIDTVFSCTSKCIVTMVINEYGFYGNISAIICQTILHIFQSLQNYSINLHEIFWRHGYGYTMKYIAIMGSIKMQFLWQHMSWSCPFMVYQHSLIIWMAMHQISPYVQLPLVSIMTGGHTWPVNLLMPRDPGWTLMDMSFPTKTINGCYMAVQVMSLKSGNYTV